MVDLFDHFTSTACVCSLLVLPMTVPNEQAITENIEAETKWLIVKLTRYVFIKPFKTRDDMYAIKVVVDCGGIRQGGK